MDPALTGFDISEAGAIIANMVICYLDAGGTPPRLRIPTQGGQVFRFHRGHHSDLIAATVPI